jgi:hypothetical protein
MIPKSAKIVIGFIVFSICSTPNYIYANTPCNEEKKWNSPPDFEKDGYVHSSLVKMLEFVRTLKQHKIKNKLKIHECIALSLFAEAYRISAEPCSERSLKHIREWAEYCTKDRWFDPDASGFSTCGIFGITPLVSFAPLYFDTLFAEHPECEIGTVEDFRKKVIREDIEKAIRFIESPDAPDCEQIRNPSFWTKLMKMPKDPFKIRRIRALAYEASNKARELFPIYKKEEKECSALHNGKGDAFRHCYWACLITKSYGSKTAADYSDFHEFNPLNPCNEAIMDYKNNRVGISYGNTDQDCSRSCLNSSELQIILEEKCF